MALINQDPCNNRGDQVRDREVFFAAAGLRLEVRVRLLALFLSLPYPAERRAQTRFLARIEPARVSPLGRARATFFTQPSIYDSAGYGMSIESVESIE